MSLKINQYDTKNILVHISISTKSESVFFVPFLKNISYWIDCNIYIEGEKFFKMKELLSELLKEMDTYIENNLSRLSTSETIYSAEVSTSRICERYSDEEFKKIFSDKASKLYLKIQDIWFKS